jgi:hypothetical protein
VSIVLVGPTGPLGDTVFDRLNEQGDAIRVIVEDETSGAKWKQRGAFVAVAKEWDADLIERASYEARTIVVFPQETRDESELLEEVATGAGVTSVDRVIVIRSEASVLKPLVGARVDHVVLGTGKRSLLRRGKPVDDDVIARAVDAADDLDGKPRLVVDLTKASGIRALGL